MPMEWFMEKVITMPGTKLKVRMIDRFALITGGCHGIGLEIAKKFAEEGINLYLVSRSKTKLLKTLSIFKKNYKNIRVLGILGDIRTELFQKKLKKIKKINFLINSAATANKKHFLKSNKNDFDNVFNTNVKALFFISQIVSKIMKKNESRSYIINLGSTLGLIGNYNRVIYSSSKFAVEGITKSMALDLIKFNINVNSIAPTKVITKHNENKKKLNIIKNKIPQKKFPRSREIAEVCYFLCSGKIDSATGSTIVVDGGWTIL